MKLGLVMTTQLRQIQKCSVCTQKLDSNAAEATAIESNIFGHVPFAICPCCGQQVPDMKAKTYLGRAALWVQNQALAALREKHGRCKAGLDGECAYAECPQAKVYLSACPLWVDDTREE